MKTIEDRVDELVFVSCFLEKGRYEAAYRLSEARDAEWQARVDAVIDDRNNWRDIVEQLQDERAAVIETSADHYRREGWEEGIRALNAIAKVFGVEDLIAKGPPK